MTTLNTQQETIGTVEPVHIALAQILMNMSITTLTNLLATVDTNVIEDFVIKTYPK